MEDLRKREFRARRGVPRLVGDPATTMPRTFAYRGALDKGANNKDPIINTAYAASFSGAALTAASSLRRSRSPL
jgi:hypothetical protein